jgi:hypothetical protein
MTENNSDRQTYIHNEKIKFTANSLLRNGVIFIFAGMFPLMFKGSSVATISCFIGGMIIGIGSILIALLYVGRLR